MNYNVSPVLEYLDEVDHVFVQQRLSLCEILSDCELSNAYVLKNQMREDIMTVAENSNCCVRQVCGPSRYFDMILRDNQEQDVIHLHRPLRCECCCFPGSCLQTIEVSCPPGVPIGTVSQEWSFCTPLGGKFVVQNPSGDDVLRIQGPTIPIACCEDLVFEILTDDGSATIGAITRHWQGICTELVDEMERLSITFPKDLDLRTKVLLLGATFLIDFMYFEKRNS